MLDADGQRTGAAREVAPLVEHAFIVQCSAPVRRCGRRAEPARLLSFPPVPTTEADHQRALEVQAALASQSHHRAVSLVDALVAATAEARELAVLHYDGDFELVAEIT